MLCGCWRDRWPIRCLRADEVERGFYNASLFCSLFGQLINLVISNDVCVGFDFVDGDIVVGVFCIFIIRVMRSLFGGLYWKDGFLMWLRRRYMLLRLSMNMNVFVAM